VAAYYNSDAPARAARLFKIVTLIASRRSGERLGREKLAEACDCTIKTIQRDLQCLVAADIPIEWDANLRSYALPNRGWKFPLAQMTPTDVMALAIARGLLLNTAGVLPYAPEIAAAIEKVTAGLTPMLRSLLESASHSLVERDGMARDYSRAPLGALLEAMSMRETIEMKYESRSGGTNEFRKVDPYRLDRRDGRYFELHAWCHKRNSVRTFALDRITEVRKTGETFEARPWEEELEGVVGGIRGGPFVSIEIRFDPVVASYARERLWPFKASFEEMGDGSLVMRGAVRGVEGIARELLTWQRHAEALGGPELRERMAEEARALAALYAET
jgi:predicted DNA-binding transcriptional regulator YafY